MQKPYTRNEPKSGRKTTPGYSGVVLLPKASFIARAIDISTALEKGAGHAIEIKSRSSEHGGPLVLQGGEVSTSKTTRQTEPEYRVQQLGKPSGLDAVLESLGATASGSARIAPKSVPGRVSSPRCNGNETNPCELDPEDFAKFHKQLLGWTNFSLQNSYSLPRRH